MENLFVLVSHSLLLRAIVPTTMLELIYTGEIIATSTEVDEIKTRLTLLGILSPSASSLAVGVVNCP